MFHRFQPRFDNLSIGFLKRDDHNWSEPPHSPERESPNEERTDRSTGNEKLVSVGTA
jgi:putative transposase